MKDYKLYDEKTLLELLSENDEIAFTEIYNRFWKRLFYIAYSKLKEEQNAEDIVHDVFISLWVNRGKSEILQLENYLATAAKYLVLAKIKKNQREFKYIATLNSPVIDLQIESSLHYKRILEIVNNEVEKFPEKCRIIFKCSRVDGMPVKQIAHKLDISPKTVENQLNKALKHLKSLTRPFLIFF